MPIPNGKDSNFCDDLLITSSKTLLAVTSKSRLTRKRSPVEELTSTRKRDALSAFKRRQVFRRILKHKEERSESCQISRTSSWNISLEIRRS
uniref:Protein tantalus n=1 Tax=Rodentolepis nana TaxID=102285 RepID=A0A0R3TAJ1_RODNA